MPSITPLLWFDGRAEAAVEFYLTVFDGRAELTVRSPVDGPIPKGEVVGIGFALDGQSFIALNAPKGMGFAGPTSLMVECADQAELDRIWAALLADGGKPMTCGWLSDRFGVAWQLVPAGMGAMLGSEDTQAATRVNRSMLSMVKLDVAALEAAYKGETP
jgi:predicted 3-demethylubiquinone-9 3-methyltransferase (glyoxalase superfamily)